MAGNLERMLAKHPSLMAKHGIIAEEVWTLAEIIAAEQEYFDKVWYVRKLIREEKVENGEVEPPSPELAEQAEAAMRAIEKRYGAENVGPWDDWTWVCPRQARRTALGAWQRVGLSRHVDREPSRPVQAAWSPCRSRARWKVNPGPQRTATVNLPGPVPGRLALDRLERIPRICLIRMRSQVQVLAGPPHRMRPAETLRRSRHPMARMRPPIVSEQPVPVVPEDGLRRLLAASARTSRPAATPHRAP
jgi:hypothetical protein